MIAYQVLVLLLLLGCLVMMFLNVRSFRTVPVVDEALSGDAPLNPNSEVDRGGLTQFAGRECLSSGLTVSKDTPRSSSSHRDSASCASSSAPTSELGLISVLVPARNEALRISPCASSLACQRYPNYEVLVLDDNSEDGTGDVLRKLGYSDDPSARLRILTGQTLPSGWTGKGWACHQLASAAKGEYLLFVDADTTHVPQMLASALAMAQSTRADLLSAWPRLLALTWSEKLVLPMLHVAFIYYPHALWEWLQRNPEWLRRMKPESRRAFGAANGQFIFVRKAAYEQIGGHAGCRSHMVEDLALGRATAREGLRLVNCDGSSISQVRMYSRFSEVWEGFTKNTRAAFENSLAFYFVTGVVVSATFLLPFVFVWLTEGVARWLVLGQIAIIYAIRIRLTCRFGTSWLGCFLHPAGQFLITAIALNSWRCSAGKGVTWKGRRYEVVHPQS